MNDLIIQPTGKTPEIILTPGNISFSGRSIIDNILEFFEPVKQWMHEYVEHPADSTEVTVKYEYLDSRSTQVLYQLLAEIQSITKKGYTVHIKWHYEYGDVEMVKLGEIIQNRLETEFEFIEI